MTTSPQIQQNDASRVWTIHNGANPTREPRYEGIARADTPEDPRGDVTPIYIPDPDSYGRFRTAGIVRGERGLPTMTVMWWYTADAASIHDRLVRAGCPTDIQVHMGECKNPQDFNGGWDKILVLKGGQPTGWTASSLGALQPDQRSSVTEEIPFTGETIFHIYPMAYNQRAEAQIVQEVIDIRVCDSVSCGLCSPVSNGCEAVFALTLSNAGSPGLPAEFLFSQDGGETWTDRTVTTLAANEDPNAFACVGANVVIISEDSESLHYAPIADIVRSAETWIEVSTGFVATNGPLAIWSGAPSFTWIVGENGYIYFTANPTTGVTVQDAGAVTTEDLNCVHGFDINNVVIAGNNNTVLVSRNGTSWTSIVGPSVGNNLVSCFVVGPNLWWIGDDAGGLFYTEDGGTTWVQKNLPVTLTRIDDIKFANETVGYVTGRTSTPSGVIFRTIDGGNSWYAVPEATGLSIPANDRINRLAICEEDVNLVFAGGLDDDGSDGIIIKGVGPS